MAKKSKLDTSDELHIYRFKNGIKLIKPSEMDKTAYNSNHAISNVSQLPVSFYLLNSEGETLKINDEGVVVCGFDSAKQSLGKSILDVSEKESASVLINNCHDVMQTSAIKIFEEQHFRKDGLAQQFLSVKSPWYDENNKIVGTCGFSIVLGRHPLANTLTMISKLGLLNTENSVDNLNPAAMSNGVQLSKREMECLQLTVKGYTAKRIAQQLEISHRTVEEYLTNIKIKMKVSTKAELIELAMNYL